MERYGLIGYPIGHSGSPGLFRRAYGKEAVYDLLETPDFNSAWEMFMRDYRAVNVTSPFKGFAASRSDFRSEAVVRTGAANVLVKASDGVHAYNTDVNAVRSILKEYAEGCRSCAVLGLGGAGRAAMMAAQEAGMDVSGMHHDQIGEGVCADVVVYTLPRPVPGCGGIRCRVLVEANYRDPGFREGSAALMGALYVSGTQWLLRQAEAAFPLMTGREPQNKALARELE